MEIVLNHAAAASIVIPEESSPREIFAANELCKYIHAITGATLPIASASNAPQGNLILVGGPGRNGLTARHIGKAAFDELAPGPEGFLIRTADDRTLILAGSEGPEDGRQRGTVYAVYEFLERYLGCGFTAYGKPGSGLGEYVPSCADITIGEADFVMTRASLPYRAAIVQFDGCDNGNATADHPLAPSLVDWLMKNRLNRMLLSMESYLLFRRNGVLGEIEKRGLSLTVGHHDSGTYFLPPLGNGQFPERYYDTHPEYYKLLPGGGRYLAETKWHGQLVFCLRNRQCAEAVAANITRWLEDNPAVDAVTLWPNDDSEPHCGCHECAGHTKMTNYAWYVNEVAKLVNQSCPRASVDMLVYQDLWEPPVGVELNPSVIVDLSTWGPGNILRRFGNKNGAGLIGTGVERNAMAWSQIAGGMVYYDYYMTNFGSQQVYCPMADEITVLCEDFISKGYCKGSGTQIEAYNLWNYLFNFYVHGRKFYDASLTLEQMLGRFVRIFGGGGEYVAEAIRYLEEFSEGQGETGTECARQFAANADWDKVYALLEQAYDAETEGKLRDNIRMLRMAFRYADLRTNAPGCEELQFMSREFGGYWHSLGQTGCGIAVYDKPDGVGDVRDKWYAFARQ